MAEDAQGTGDERSAMRDGPAASRLRHISVHVIEPAPGRYFWVLLEQGTEGAAWVDMLESQKPCRHWNHATNRRTFNSSTSRSSLCPISSMDSSS